MLKLWVTAKNLNFEKFHREKQDKECDREKTNSHREKIEFTAKKIKLTAKNIKLTAKIFDSPRKKIRGDQISPRITATANYSYREIRVANNRVPVKYDLSDFFNFIYFFWLCEIQFWNLCLNSFLTYT